MVSLHIFPNSADETGLSLYPPVSDGIAKGLMCIGSVGVLPSVFFTRSTVRVLPLLGFLISNFRGHPVGQLIPAAFISFVVINVFSIISGHVFLSAAFALV